MKEKSNMWRLFLLAVIAGTIAGLIVGAIVAAFKGIIFGLVIVPVFVVVALGYVVVLILYDLPSCRFRRGIIAKKDTVGMFRAKVNYIQPKYEELKSVFNWVAREYRKAKFEVVDSCKTVSRKTRKVVFRYVHMNRHASTDEVLVKMDKRGLRPALYEELLAFAKKYPDEQKQFCIIALGSFWVNSWGDRRVAGLNWIGNERDLTDLCCDTAWGDSCRFLAVPK